MSCLSALCCEEEDISCIQDVCLSKAEVDGDIAAIGLVEQASIPKIGDTITSCNQTIILSECNYAEGVLLWLRGQQLEGNRNGEFFHFLPSGMVLKGTRAKPTSSFDENGSGYFPKTYLGYEASATIMLGKSYLPNADVFCQIMKRQKDLSVIYFLQQGVFVLDDSNDINASIDAPGFEISGDSNQYIMGDFSIKEKGKCQPKFYYASDKKAFLKSLKEYTKFTFAAPTGITGLTPYPCSTASTCLIYEAAIGAPFTITFPVNETCGCVGYQLLYQCDKKVPAGIPVLIDSLTAGVESTGLTAAGTYEFNVMASNNSCIKGTQCFKVIVK